MKILLDATATEWQHKARQFAEEDLIPCELEAEMNTCKVKGLFASCVWR